MTIALDTRLGAAAQAAKTRIAVDLASSAGQPVMTYCGDLIDWVIFGQRKPTGTPTARVRSAVCAAINVGLVEAYGSERASDINTGITTRRDVL